MKVYRGGGGGGAGVHSSTQTLVEISVEKKRGGAGPLQLPPHTLPPPFPLPFLPLVSSKTLTCSYIIMNSVPNIWLHRQIKKGENIGTFIECRIL